MQNFIKVIAVVAVIAMIIIASLFVLDVVTVTETKDILQKILLVLGIIALGGVVIGLFARPTQQP